MANKYVNIEEIGKILSGGVINELGKNVTAAEKTVQNILKQLSDLDAAQAAKKLEEQRLAQEQKETPAQPAESKAEATQPAEIKAENKPETTKPAESKTETTQPAETKAESVQTAEKPTAPAKETPREAVQPRANAPKERPSTTKTFVNSDTRNKTDRPARTPNQPGARPQQGNRPFNQARPQQGARPQQAGGARFQSAPAATAQPSKPANKNFGADKKKQSFEKTYVEKERRAPSKRALAKSQGPGIDDFDENKSGYRKLRVKKDKKQQNTQTVKIEHAVVTTDEIPIKVLYQEISKLQYPFLDKNLQEIKKLNEK